jgi:LysR family nitrogen assimilation transcriptional regulator
MDLKRLRTFVAVAEHGTVSKAAAVLNITQPALSRQISALEHDFGFALFERSGRCLVLTPRGEQLLGSCRSLLACAATLTERAQALKRGHIKELKITATAVTIETLFPAFLHFYAERVPGVRVRIAEADPDDHLRLLKHGAADLAINVINNMQVDDNRFGNFVLPPFHMIAVCPRSLKAAECETIDIRKLCEQPLLLLNASKPTRTAFDALCQIAGVRPNIFAESAAPRVLLQLAEAGHGVAVVPSILQHDLGKLCSCKVTYRGDPILLRLAVLWDRLRILPQHAQEFSELLAEHIRAQFPSERRPERLAVVR